MRVLRRLLFLYSVFRFPCRLSHSMPTFDTDVGGALRPRCARLLMCPGAFSAYEFDSQGGNMPPSTHHGEIYYSVLKCPMVSANRAERWLKPVTVSAVSCVRCETVSADCAMSVMLSLISVVTWVCCCVALAMCEVI